MLDFMNELLDKFVGMLTNVLPTSPFKKFLSSMDGIPYLDYLNWFIPVGALIKIMEVWLGVIALFYLYSILMRWVKMIGD